MLGFERNFLLVPILIASLLSAIIIPSAGHLSDRVGRKPVSLVGVVGTGIWGFIYFGLHGWAGSAPKAEPGLPRAFNNAASAEQAAT